MSGTIRILSVGDIEAPYLWDYYTPGKLDGIDLILSTGDLDPRYLSFLATFSHGPVLYVHGNHDERYNETPPEGCISVEDTVYVYRGLRIVGLGGSMRYRAGNYQYTERQMERRIKRLQLPILRAGGCDVLLTHAPAKDLHDGKDIAHTGFACFNDFMDRYKPACFVHSHVHKNYSETFQRTDEYHGVRIINAYDRYVFEAPLPEQPQTKTAAAVMFLRTPRGR